MRVLAVLALGTVLLSPAAAADLDGPYGQDAPLPPPAYIVPGSIVVAPRPTILVVPAPAPPPPLVYGPPTVYTAPPPLIAAVPIIGAYLVPAPYGPPPATALDAYDHRYDYNQ